MSDDEDYMSDKFLQGMEDCHPPPSLLHRRSDRRELELMKKKAEIEAQRKPIKIVEQEKREEGLASAISSGNKGFEMLMKMGYKPGQGIGKTESGRTEPIGVAVKADRQGLGRSSKKTEIKKKNLNSKLDSTNLRDFRDRIAKRKAEQTMSLDLRKSQKICEQLDIQKNVEKPLETWFWLDKKTEIDNETDSAEETKSGKAKSTKQQEDEIEEEEQEEEEEEEEEEESLPVDEKLQILTKYLREKHFYCIWCGTAFNDEVDLRDNCPGQTRNDH